MTALALTDHGNLHGSLKFYQTAQKLGISPILGTRSLHRPGQPISERGGRRERGRLPSDAPGTKSHGLSQSRQAFVRRVLGGVLFPAADRQGTAGRPPGRPHLPKRLRFERVEPHVACRRRGELAKSRGNRRLVPKALRRRLLHRDPEQPFGSRSRRRWRARSKSPERLGIPLVATSDVHYVHREDAEAQDILLCINTGKFRTDTNRMRMETNEFYLRSAEEMYAAFPGHGRRPATHAGDRRQRADRVGTGPAAFSRLFAAGKQNAGRVFPRAVHRGVEGALCEPVRTAIGTGNFRTK